MAAGGTAEWGPGFTGQGKRDGRSSTGSSKGLDVTMLCCGYAFVRTTLGLRDDLFRQVKAKAALEGATLKNMLTPGHVRGMPAT